MYLFIKSLLSVYYVPGHALGPSDVSENKREGLSKLVQKYQRWYFVRS